MKISSRFPLETIGIILFLTIISYFYLVTNPISPSKNVKSLSFKGNGNGSMTLSQVILNSFEPLEVQILSQKLKALSVSDPRGLFSLDNNTLIPSVTDFGDEMADGSSILYFLFDVSKESDNQLFLKWEEKLLEFQTAYMGNFWGYEVWKFLRKLEVCILTILDD